MISTDNGFNLNFGFRKQCPTQTMVFTLNLDSRKNVLYRQKPLYANVAKSITVYPLPCFAIYVEVGSPNSINNLMETMVLPKQQETLCFLFIYTKQQCRQTVAQTMGNPEVSPKSTANSLVMLLSQRLKQPPINKQKLVRFYKV